MYNHLLNNNMAEAFTASFIGNHHKNVEYHSRLWKRRLKAILIAQGTDDPDSTTARYIRAGRNRYRVNVNFHEWNPVVLQPQLNIGAPLTQEEAQNNEAAAQPQRPGGDVERGDAGQAIPDQNALDQDEVAQVAQGIQAGDMHAAEVLPVGDELNARESQIQAQLGLNIYDDLVVPPGMSTETALLYKTRLKESKDDIVSMKSLISSLVGLEEPGPVFKKLWLLALYSRTEIQSAYSILTMATTYGRTKHKRAFFDSMLKLEDDVIVQNDDLDFFIPHGMKKSTALSCWFMLEDIRANTEHCYSFMKWLTVYDDKNELVNCMNLLGLHNEALMRAVNRIVICFLEGESNIIW